MEEFTDVSCYIKEFIQFLLTSPPLEAIMQIEIIMGGKDLFSHNTCSYITACQPSPNCCR